MVRVTLYFAILSIPLLFLFCKKNKPSDIQSEFFVKFFGVSGENRGVDVCQSNDGGYFVLGTSVLSGKGSEIVLVKTDQFGNEEWAKYFGDSLDDFAKSMRITSDGGIILLGTTTSLKLQSLQTDMFLVKTDNHGNKSWAWKFGSDSTNQEGNCVQQTSDGGFILVGSTTDENLTNQNPGGIKDIYLIKTDASGNLIWSQSRGGKKDDVGNFIQQLPSGGYIIVGSTESFSNAGQDKSNIIFIETNENGAQTKMYPFGNLEDDYGECIQILSDNNYLISGTYGFPDNTTGMYIAKLDGAHPNITIWQKNVEISSGTLGKSIQETSDNGFILTGASSKTGNKDICLIKLVSDGTINFTKYFGEFGGEESGNKVKQTTDGGFIITGTNNYDGPSMVTLIKVNASGEQK